MVIRSGIEADIPDLLRIGHDFYFHNVYREHVDIDDESLSATFRMLMSADEHVLLVAQVEGKVIGAAAAMSSPLYWNQRYRQGIEFFWWIDPEHRGGGNGKALKQRLQEEAAARGVKFWNMIALEDSMHEQVKAMYQKSGFRLVESIWMKVL